jgi:hypothetical protein
MEELISDKIELLLITQATLFSCRNIANDKDYLNIDSTSSWEEVGLYEAKLEEIKLEIINLVSDEAYN